jgi:hypothetical protein
LIPTAGLADFSGFMGTEVMALSLIKIKKNTDKNTTKKALLKQNGPGVLHPGRYEQIVLKIRTSTHTAPGQGAIHDDLAARWAQRLLHRGAMVCNGGRKIKHVQTGFRRCH